MKVLLAAINAKYIHSNLGIYSLKTYGEKMLKEWGLAEQAGISLAEYTINHQMEQILQDIYKRKPDVIGFSCYIWNISYVKVILADIKKVLPDVKIWAGGPEVSYHGEAFLKEEPAVDLVMMGEGEITFAHFLKALLEGEDLKQVPGLMVRNADGTFTDTGFRQVMDMSQIPFPYAFMDMKELEHRIIYYESSRGCPFSCAYCLSSIDKKLRFRSLDLVLPELEWFLQAKVPQVKFVDRTFNCKKSHAMAIWQYIRDHDNGVTNFHFEIAADLLDKDELDLLSTMRPGLVQLEIGVQTVNPDALRAIHRTAPFAEIAENVTQIAQAHNVHQHLDLIAGLPYEDFESFRTSFDAVYQLYPQELQLGFLKVLRGSEMYERAEEYGIVYRSTPSYEVLATKWITCDELLRLKEIEEMLEVYYNSLQYRNTIRAAQQLFTRPIELYEALADYYGQEGLNGKSWSRLQRLEILRRFLHAVDERTEAGMPRFRGRSEEPADPACFDELLTLDLYLRENAKSRPDWAPDQNEEKDAVIEFYKKEEAAHHYLPELADRSWKQLMRMTHLEYFEHCRLAKVSPEVQAEPVKQSCGTEPMTGMENRPGSDSSRTRRDGQWVLFCYEKRDVLTGDARVQVLPTDFCSVQLNRIKQHSVMTYLKDGPACGKIK